MGNMSGPLLYWKRALLRMHKNCGEDEEKNVCAMQIHYILKQYNGYNGFLGFVVYAAEHDLLGIRICVVRCTGYIVR